MGLSPCNSKVEPDLSPVKIFLLSEGRILRETLARLFRKRADLRVVGQCPYSETAAAQVVESLCDVLLLDQPTLVSSSANVIPQIIANSPERHQHLVAMGLTNKEIASHLNLSEYTVKNHIHRLLKQVDAGSRYEAIENIRASGFAVVSQAAPAA